MNCCVIRAWVNPTEIHGEAAMFKTILAPLSGTDSDASVLSTSLRIASGANGHIECLHLRRDATGLLVEGAQIGMETPLLMADAVTAFEQEATRRTASARANFDKFCQQENIGIASEPSSGNTVTVSWREESGDEFNRLTELARCHDVVVLPGDHNRIGGLPAKVAGDVIMGGGRPVLLAPEVEAKGPFNRIAIAWNDTAEAARAMTAAMPLLECAHQIDVLSVCEVDKHAGECVNMSDTLVRYLRWHGCFAHTRFLVSEGRTPAEAALDETKHTGADLLVMGAYGHSRMHEFIFGGFTARILKGVDLPVLLFH
jgi:hypothetical protein